MKILKQYAVLLVGLFIASMGVALSTIAGLGTSPIASVPYSVSLIIQTVSFGTWLNILSLIQIIVQIILLGKRCKPVEMVIQMVMSFAYGYLTDFSRMLLSRIIPASYAEQFVWMLVGCVVLGLGLWIQYKANVAMLPGEAMNRAVSQVTGKRYENVKIFFDAMYILVSAAICLLFLGKLKGVREGSIVAALLVGNIIRLCNRGYEKLRNRLTRS